MLITFICIALACVALALVFMAFPLLRSRSDGGEAERTSANLALLRSQFEDLEKERRDGRITPDEYKETRAEIEQRVLEETGTQARPAAGRTKTGLYSFLCLIVCVPVLAFLGYTSLGTPQALDPQFTTQHTAAQMGHSEKDLLEQLQALEDRLRANPDNLNGWLMLAKTSASFKNWDKASSAFAQVNRLSPDNADTLADWADVLAASQGGKLEGKPLELIDAALKIDPTHWKALALKGTICFNQRDYSGAVTYWERMREGTEPGSQEWREVTENIEQARSLGGVSLNKKTQTLVPARTVEKPPVAQAGQFIRGRVELAPALAGSIRPNDVVFVFARPLTGSKMPVAFKRYSASELPVTFTLDSASSMASGVKTLNDVSEVIVEARLSRTGNFMPSSGDLEGVASGAVQVGSQSVHIVIDRAVP